MSSFSPHPRTPSDYEIIHINRALADAYGHYDDDEIEGLTTDALVSIFEAKLPGGGIERRAVISWIHQPGFVAVLVHSGSSRGWVPQELDCHGNLASCDEGHYLTHLRHIYNSYNPA